MESVTFRTTYDGRAGAPYYRNATDPVGISGHRTRLRRGSDQHCRIFARRRRRPVRWLGDRRTRSESESEMLRVVLNAWVTKTTAAPPVARKKPCGEIGGLAGDGIAAVALAADRCRPNLRRPRP